MLCTQSTSLTARNAVDGKLNSNKVLARASPIAVQVKCSSESSEVFLTTRRNLSSSVAVAATALTVSSAKPSLAAYGEGANVFGKSENKTEFLPFAGDGFAVLIPVKFNPSKEREYEGTVMRYEDNADLISCVAVTINPTNKSSITEYGSPQDFLSTVSFLLGQSSQVFITGSEGGFGANRVAAASVLSAESVIKKGKTYYEIDVLTRTADGDEGGKHQLISGTVSNGKLYLYKMQIGDKRWFKGLDRPATASWRSFTVA
mmetsp:Transcript_15147/g.20903  ORF Transcript_15147/g.20903 Transcript_15147/m.20903 type:complete len:260 (-) Transcript_15147:83-862(-)|eukprot:CAMPEP_0196581554 /NCGR_PEP_ID=MMETSP1081-20130531/34204_1 /TAXON_ID=36882 /ORGANISM="Pyramimonas amylifera, Strain CCMP720" /LENGTH=259 /DNA_ID=CAMNT_0041901821 /DNA_START=81 /DNA_END=860 /DNA_ORIENTATION=+